MRASPRAGDRHQTQRSEAKRNNLRRAAPTVASPKARHHFRHAGSVKWCYIAAPYGAFRSKLFHDLYCSVPWSLNNFAPSLPRSLAPSLPHSLPRSYAASLSPPLRLSVHIIKPKEALEARRTQDRVHTARHEAEPAETSKGNPETVECSGPRKCRGTTR